MKNEENNEENHNQALDMDPGLVQGRFKGFEAKI